MGFLKVGDKDADGRQKRIEYSGRYLRASRTGGVSLRAQTRAAGINLTGNTNHGVRVSTRLAKNTQVAFQNGRFVLRGRYGSDAAKINLSKTGVTVSSKTALGSFNWIKPGRSSAKFAGVQLRGHKAATIQMVYLALTAVAGGLRLLARGTVMMVDGLARLTGWGLARIEQARQDRVRLNLSTDEIKRAGAAVLAEQGIDLSAEPRRDLFAGLLFTLTVLGRGDDRFVPRRAGLDDTDSAVAVALIDDLDTVGAQITTWLGADREARAPTAVLGVLFVLAAAWAEKMAPPQRAAALLALDDACLAAGPRTILQEEMLDALPRALGVELQLEGES